MTAPTFPAKLVQRLHAEMAKKWVKFNRDMIADVLTASHHADLLKALEAVEQNLWIGTPPDEELLPLIRDAIKKGRGE